MIDVAAGMFAPEFPSLLLVLVLLLLNVDHVGLHKLLNFDFADDVVIFDGSGHLEVIGDDVVLDLGFLREKHTDYKKRKSIAYSLLYSSCSIDLQGHINNIWEPTTI